MVDPLAEIPSQIAHSPYAYAWNNPISMIDPTGMSAEACKDCPEFKDGNIGEGTGLPVFEFQSTPDFSSIHWDNQKAQMGWVDEKAMQENGSRNQGTQRNFGDKISFSEARSQWLNGKGSSLHVFLRNINLSKIKASDFEEGVGQVKSFNLANKYFDNINDALVYGSINLKLINPNTVVVSRPDSKGLPMDVYDFDLKDWKGNTLIRNFETIGGWVVNGGNYGKPYIIWIYGEAKISEN